LAQGSQDESAKTRHREESETTTDNLKQAPDGSAVRGLLRLRRDCFRFDPAQESRSYALDALRPNPALDLTPPHRLRCVRRQRSAPEQHNAPVAQSRYWGVVVFRATIACNDWQKCTLPDSSFYAALKGFVQRGKRGDSV